MLEKEHDITIVGEAEDGRMAEQLARELVPDVIIMDVAMPDLNGIEATRQITANRSGIKIIALSMHDDRRFVLNMLKAGAAGYILKDDAFKSLSKAIRMVMSNKSYLSNQIADMVDSNYFTSSHRHEINGQSVTFRQRKGSPSIGGGRQDLKSDSRKAPYQCQDRRNSPSTGYV